MESCKAVLFGKQSAVKQKNAQNKDLLLLEDGSWILSAAGDNRGQLTKSFPLSWHACALHYLKHVRQARQLRTRPLKTHVLANHPSQRPIRERHKISEHSIESGPYLLRFPKVMLQIEKLSLQPEAGRRSSWDPLRS